MMKKFFTKSWFKAACVAILGLMSVDASAQTPDATFDFRDIHTQINTDYTINGITATHEAHWDPYGADLWHQQGYNTGLTISCDTKKIVKVVFSDSWLNGPLVYNTGNVVEQDNSSSATWVGSTNSITFRAPDGYDYGIHFAEVYLEGNDAGGGSNPGSDPEPDPEPDPNDTPTDNYSNALNTQALFNEFTVINANNDDYMWSFDAYYGAARIGYNNNYAMNDYLVSPAIVITGGTYRLSANIKEQDSTWPERFELVYGTDPTAVALNNVVLGPTTPTTSYSVYSGEFAISAPGTYYFAVHGISDAGMYNLYAKDFVLEQLSGLSSSPAVNIASVANGSIVAKVNGTPITSGDEIETGTVVTLEATPDAKYEFISWDVTGATVADASAATTTFTVGNQAVTISASFDLKGKVNATTQFNFSDYTAHTIAVGEVLDSNPAGVTLSFSAPTANTRIYSYGSLFDLSIALDNNFTIAAPANGHIKEVRFFGASTSYPGYAFWEDNDVATNDANYQNLTWTAATPVNSITFSCASNRVYRVGKIEVDYDYVPATSADVTVSAGYATYYNATKAYVMPADCEGYVFSAANGLELAYVAGAVVPADEPLILKAAQGTYTLDYSDETGTKFAGQNDLRGAAANMTAAEMSAANPGKTKFYALSLNAASDPSSIGFYWINEGGAAFDMPAGKAYLALSAAAAGENRGWSFAEMENGLETAISLTPSLSESEGACYDLYGRRTNGKGLMIQNGKVVLVK